MFNEFPFQEENMSSLNTTPSIEIVADTKFKQIFMNQAVSNIKHVLAFY